MSKTEISGEYRFARRQELLDSYGEDPFDDLEVIRWYKVFNIDDAGNPVFIYPYVAMRARDRWVIGGQTGKVDWLDLLIEIEHENLIEDPIDNVEIADGFYLMVPPDEDDDED